MAQALLGQTKLLPWTERMHHMYLHVITKDDMINVGDCE
uniref:Uncharacterized protein n=1 Tax=Anguilla anguilla TaxID=7936 RepID=A0A0E9W4B8_ANGAN